MKLLRLLLPDFAEKLVVALMVIAVGLFIYTAGYNSAENSWQDKWNKHLEQSAEKEAAVNESRKNTMRLVREGAKEEVLDAKKKLADQTALAADASAVANSLRGEVSKLRAELLRLGVVAGTATGGSTDTSAVILLADLYGSCVANRQELAAAVDESRARGLTCEAYYDNLDKLRTPIGLLP